MSPLLPRTLAAYIVAFALTGLLFLWDWARRKPERAAWPREAGSVMSLVGLVAGFFWRPLFTSDVWLPLGGGDLASFFYPLYSFIYRSIQAGQFPLWNPYTFAGMPLAADVQTGMFYPPNLLAWYALPSYDYGTLEWLLILHYLWAALGMYAWLRVLRLRCPAAVAGAAAFAFCGFMVAHFGHMPMVFAAAWLPWNLLLARRAAISRNPAWLALAGGALALTFLAGHPQTLLYEGLAVGLYWAFLSANGETQAAASGRWPLTMLPAAWRGMVWRLPLVTLIAVGLAAVQLLPSQELSGQSLRVGISYEQASAFSVQPVGLLGLVLPRVFGADPLGYWVPWQSTETWGYLGIVALLLAGAAIFLRRDRRLGFPIALGVLALLGMLGPFSIVFSWLHGLMPYFDKFRAAGRLLLLLGLANATLAALGLDALLRLLPAVSKAEPSPTAFPTVEEMNAASEAGADVTMPEPSRYDALLGEALAEDGVAGPGQARRVRRLPLIVGLPTALLALVVLPLATAIFLSAFSLERSQIVLNDAYIAVVWLALVTGLLWAGVRGRLGGRSVALALAALLVSDLFSPNSHFNPTSQDILRGYEQPGATAFLRDHTGPPNYYRIDSDTDVSVAWQPLLGTLEGIPDAGGLYNPLQLSSYANYWNTAKQHRDTVIYDLLSINYTLAISPSLISNPKFTQVAGGLNSVKIAENKHADPRLFLIHDAAVEPDDTAAVGKLLNGTALGWHTIYLPEGKPRQSSTPSTLEAGNPGETATITSYTPNRIEATVDVKEAGWAVLTDVWYPGWQATVDGTSVEIDRADTIFRAVPVTSGKHKIVWSFEWPVQLVTGLAITAVTLLLTLVFAFWAGRWRKTEPAAT
ncbi:MAG: YfhO family protein [Chloroflexia bacterium]